MVELIIGGSGSGKSEYAEQRAAALCGSGEPLVYVATMEHDGADAEERIERHHKLREGKGFQTVEKHSDLVSLRVPENATVLLECMSNLLANEMFGAGGYYIKRIIMGIERLRYSCKNLVLVSDDVFSDGICYGGETEKYKRALGELNRYYAEQSDRVTEVVFSVPDVIKEKTND